MARNVTGALMGDPGFWPSPAAHAFEPRGGKLPAAHLRLDDPVAPRGLPAAHTARQLVAPNTSNLLEFAPEAVVEQAAGGGAELRPVAPISDKLSAFSPGPPATSPPVFMDVSPTELLIDGAYQRDLSERSLRLIGRIVEAWDWRRFKPPVCAWTEAGLVIIDGQHTAIAAATHGGFPTIPVMVVEAADAKEQASAFVGHNRDRLALHPTQIHHAAVAAGEPEALALERVVAAAGARIVRNPYGSRAYRIGDTIAVGTLAGLIRDSGEDMAVTVLRLLVEGERGLISKDQIRAVVELLTKPEYADEFAPADLPAAIRKTADTVERDAKLFAADHKTAFWRGMVNVWFRAVKKRRVA